MTIAAAKKNIVSEENAVRVLYSFLTDMCDGGTYDCVEENHEQFMFTFCRQSDGTLHKVNLEKAIAGFQEFTDAVLVGELDGIIDMDASKLENLDSWECQEVDFLLQYTIDGVITEP